MKEMTATIEERGTEHGAGGVGRIARVIGPVVDIEFPSDSMPEIYNKLTVAVELVRESQADQARDLVRWAVMSGARLLVDRTFTEGRWCLPMILADIHKPDPIGP